MQRCGSQSRGCRASPNPALPLPVSWTLLPWPSAFQSYSSLGTYCIVSTSYQQSADSGIRHAARGLAPHAHRTSQGTSSSSKGPRCRSVPCPSYTCRTECRALLWVASGPLQDHVVEWLQYVCGPRTPDTRRICAHRERETSQSHRSILRGNGREDAHGCHQDARTAPHHRREARAPRARPTSLVINWVQSTRLIASRCGWQVVQMHSWGASTSRPSGGS